MDGNRSSRKAAALVLIVFVLGIALGAVATYLGGRRVWGASGEGRSRGDRRARMVEQLTQELSLTAEQRKRLETVLADMRQKYDAIHTQTTPQFEQVRHEGRNQIRALLSLEQRPKFEEFLRRLDEQRKRNSER